jgi:hypothetical protein
MSPRHIAMKTLLLLLACAVPLAAQEKAQPATAIEALAAYKNYSARDKLTGLVEVSGTKGVPTPEIWHLVIYDPRSPTRLSAINVRGSHVTERGPSREYYPEREPSGYFEMAKVNVDCAGAFRIADREANRAMVGFDTIDYLLRAREFGDEPVWILTLRTTAGNTAGTVTLSATGGKVLRTVWTRPGRDGKPVLEDSAVPAEFRPAPLPKLPEPFPVPPVPDTTVPAPPPPNPEEPLPPPPPLPPPGAPAPLPRITPD